MTPKPSRLFPWMLVLLLTLMIVTSLLQLVRSFHQPEQRVTVYVCHTDGDCTRTR